MRKSLVEREGWFLIWSSLRLHNTYSNFIRGQRWSLVSAALAVIGVTVFVCLTLCKRGLGVCRMKTCKGSRGWWRIDRGRESSWPSQLGYGTAAWTNPWASETTVLNSRYLVSACPERGPLHQYVPLPLSAPDIFILSGPLLYVPPQWLPSVFTRSHADGPLLVNPV